MASTFFNYDRSTTSVKLGVSAEFVSPATLRAVGECHHIDNLSSFFVEWPVGTQEGDLVVIALAHGYNVLSIPGWVTLYRDRGTWWAGAAFYKILTAADIGFGGTHVHFTNPYQGVIALAAYADGENLGVQVIDSRSTTGGGGSVLSYTIPFTAEPSKYSYLMFAGARADSINVDFALATEHSSVSAFRGSAAIGTYDPASGGSVSEIFTFSGFGNGNFAIILAVGEADANGVRPVATSTAISAASASERWAVGPLYFEMLVVEQVGTIGVGVVSGDQAFGNSVLGTGVNNFIYRHTGVVLLNGVTLATLSPYTVGDTIRVAYHPGTRLAWFAVNGGSWNNDGTADPVTFIGGIDVSNFNPKMVTPAVDFSTGGSTFAGSFDPDQFAYSPPAGYSAISVVNVEAANCVIPDYFQTIEMFHPEDWSVTSLHPDDNHSPAVSFPAGPVKLIAGEVQENGVGVPGRLVRMYNRRTGDYVGEAVTNADGEFIIPAQDPNLPHFVVAFDDDESPNYNAKIFDRVMPG
jgi:hypothetical protein